MRLKIGIGLGPLVFGMSKEEVIQHLGKPDKSVTEDYYHCFSYNSQCIRLYFSAMEEFKLDDIEVYNPRAVLFGQMLIGMRKSEILALLGMQGFHDPEQEDYETFETVYCQDIESQFSFEFNKLISISFHILFDQYDQAVWPDKESGANANDGRLDVIPAGDNPGAKRYGRPMEIKIVICKYSVVLIGINGDKRRGDTEYVFSSESDQKRDEAAALAKTLFAVKYYIYPDGTFTGGYA